MNKQASSGNISSTWKQTILVVMAVAIVLILTVFLIAQSKGQRVKIIREGDRAPEFTLQTTEGKVVSLSSLRGKVVMVHFWATWCPPCVEEIPTLDRFYRAFFGKDFELLAVSVDEGGAPDVTSFMQRNKLTLPVFLNPDRSIANLFGTFKFPETYIIDRQGIVRYKAIGARDWAMQPNMKLVQELL